MCVSDVSLCVCQNACVFVCIYMNENKLIHFFYYSQGAYLSLLVGTLPQQRVTSITALMLDEGVQRYVLHYLYFSFFSPLSHISPLFFLSFFLSFLPSFLPSFNFFSFFSFSFSFTHSINQSINQSQRLWCR